MTMTDPFAVAIGPVYRQTELAEAAGCSRQTVREWIRRRQILALTTADGVVIVPVFQLDARLRPLPGLEAVLRLLSPDVVDDWMLASWLLAPHARLDGQSVIARLRAGGDRTAVMAVAESTRSRWSQ